MNPNEIIEEKIDVETVKKIINEICQKEASENYKINAITVTEYIKENGTKYNLCKNIYSRLYTKIVGGYTTVNSSEKKIVVFIKDNKTGELKSMDNFWFCIHATFHEAKHSKQDKYPKNEYSGFFINLENWMHKSGILTELHKSYLIHHDDFLFEIDANNFGFEKMQNYLLENYPNYLNQQQNNEKFQRCKKYYRYSSDMYDPSETIDMLSKGLNNLIVTRKLIYVKAGEIIRNTITEIKTTIKENPGKVPHLKDFIIKDNKLIFTSENGLKSFEEIKKTIKDKINELNPRTELFLNNPYLNIFIQKDNKLEKTKELIKDSNSDFKSIGKTIIAPTYKFKSIEDILNNPQFNSVDPKIVEAIMGSRSFLESIEIDKLSSYEKDYLLQILDKKINFYKNQENLNNQYIASIYNNIKKTKKIGKIKNYLNELKKSLLKKEKIKEELKYRNKIKNELSQNKEYSR